MLYEYKADLAAYFAWLGANAPVVAQGRDRVQRREPGSGTEVLRPGNHADVGKEGPADQPGVPEALAKCRRLSRTEGIDALMAKHRLDALFAPTGGPAGLSDLVNGDQGGGGSSTMAAVAGLSARHGTGRLCAWPADRGVVLRAGLERGAADPDRLQLRAGHQGQTGAEVPPDRGDYEVGAKWGLLAGGWLPAACAHRPNAADPQGHHRHRDAGPVHDGARSIRIARPFRSFHHDDVGDAPDDQEIARPGVLARAMTGSGQVVGRQGEQEHDRRDVRDRIAQQHRPGQRATPAARGPPPPRSGGHAACRHSAGLLEGVIHDEQPAKRTSNCQSTRPRTSR